MKKILLVTVAFGLLFGAMQLNLQAQAQTDNTTLNQFESPKDDAEFNGVDVQVGGDFAIQFQGLRHTNEADSIQLASLMTDLNLPTANLNLNVHLYDGIRMHLRTYLSSRHHAEAWVKGGHLQIDKLDFIQEDFLKDLMEVLRVRVGMDEINYGDAHFRRSDNAYVLYNPFVGNYIMDAFTTEPFGEVTLMTDGFLGMVGVSNGKLNQSVIAKSNQDGDKIDHSLTLFGKLGYDKQIDGDLRTRITGSFYTSSGKNTGGYLYSGDRAGSRYYRVMDYYNAEGNATNNFRSGRFNPGFSQITAIQINPFVKYMGLEFFGIYEMVSSGAEEGNTVDGAYNQIAGELLYRFGSNEDFYLGGRYNMVSGEKNGDAETQEISRMNFGGGWFLTKNILTKVEYVMQSYSGDGWVGTEYEGGEFSGVVIEAAISF